MNGAWAFELALMGARLEPVEQAWIKVRDGVIVEAGWGSPPAGAQRRRIGMPGLVDAHVHLGLDGGNDVAASAGRMDIAELRQLVVHNAGRQVRSGVTTVRDLGAPRDVVLAMVGEGALSPGKAPHVVPGVAVSHPGGHGNFLARHASTRDEFLRAITEIAQSGGRLVKLFATGGVITAGSTPDAVQMPADDLAEATGLAHRLGLKVAVHAHGHPGIANALAAGVDSIEHFSYLDERLVPELGGCTLVSTLVATERFVNADDRSAATPETLAKILAHVAHERAGTRLAAQLPGHLAVGTDAGTTFNPHGWGMQEQAELLTAAGLAIDATLIAMTARSADLVDPACGVLDVGRRADLLCLEGNPLEDLDSLRAIEEVVIAGEVAHTRPHTPARSS